MTDEFKMLFREANERLEQMYLEKAFEFGELEHPAVRDNILKWAADAREKARRLS